MYQYFLKERFSTPACNVHAMIFPSSTNISCPLLEKVYVVFRCPTGSNLDPNKTKLRAQETQTGEQGATKTSISTTETAEHLKLEKGDIEKDESGVTLAVTQAGGTTGGLTQRPFGTGNSR